ncbi:MAG: hypothetical protein R6V85_20920 [Polyangia bacterium]
MGRPPADLGDELSDAPALVQLLVLGEAMTPRGQPGPLARPWVAAGPRARRREGGPESERREREGG